MKKICILLLSISFILICSCNRVEPNMSDHKGAYNDMDEKSNDPYDVLKVSKENIRNISNYYVKRNNNYYSIGNNIELSKAISYNVGYKLGYAQDYAITHIKYYNRDELKLKSITTIGDIPIFRIKPEDEIITFDITKLLLRPAKYATHTYKFYCNDMFSGENNLSIVLNPNRIEEFPIYNINKFIISSEGKDEEIDQKMISSRFTLVANENKKAIVSFFTGTTYHEYNMVADSALYYIEDEKYEIEGELHKEGYASYDISTIPDGLYYIDYGWYGGLFYKGESSS